MVLYGSDYSLLKEKHKKKLRQRTWYHGTSLASVASLESTGPLVNFNKGNELDFGHGFYLAPDLNMAKRYIETMVSYKEELQDQFPFSDDELTPVIIEYEFSELVPEDYFMDSSYITTCFPDYSEEFAKFILRNRLLPNEITHSNDLIFGVMSDGNPNKLVPLVKAGTISEDDFISEIIGKTVSTRQLSVHNQSICDNLVMKAIHYVKEGVVKHVENIGHGQQ